MDRSGGERSLDPRGSFGGNQAWSSTFPPSPGTASACCAFMGIHAASQQCSSMHSAMAARMSVEPMSQASQDGCGAEQPSQSQVLQNSVTKQQLSIPVGPAHSAGQADFQPEIASVGLGGAWRAFALPTTAFRQTARGAQPGPFRMALSDAGVMKPTSRGSHPSPRHSLAYEQRSPVKTLMRAATHSGRMDCQPGASFRGANAPASPQGGDLSRGPPANRSYSDLIEAARRHQADARLPGQLQGSPTVHRAGGIGRNTDASHQQPAGLLSPPAKPPASSFAGYGAPPQLDRAPTCTASEQLAAEAATRAREDWLTAREFYDLFGADARPVPLPRMIVADLTRDMMEELDDLRQRCSGIYNRPAMDGGDGFKQPQPLQRTPTPGGQEPAPRVVTQPVSVLSVPQPRAHAAAWQLPASAPATHSTAGAHGWMSHAPLATARPVEAPLQPPVMAAAGPAGGPKRAMSATLPELHTAASHEVAAPSDSAGADYSVAAVPPRTLSRGASCPGDMLQPVRLPQQPPQGSWGLMARQPSLLEAVWDLEEEEELVLPTRLSKRAKGEEMMTYPSG